MTLSTLPIPVVGAGRLVSPPPTRAYPQTHRFLASESARIHIRREVPFFAS
jgi:hypothetical protein